jgi:hypothetical protein
LSSSLSSSIWISLTSWCSSSISFLFFCFLQSLSCPLWVSTNLVSSFWIRPSLSKSYLEIRRLLRYVDGHIRDHAFAYVCGNVVGGCYFYRYVVYCVGLLLRIEIYWGFFSHDTWKLGVTLIFSFLLVVILFRVVV